MSDEIALVCASDMTWHERIPRNLYGAIHALFRDGAMQVNVVFEKNDPYAVVISLRARIPFPTFK